MARSVTTTVVLSNMVVVVATGLAGSVPIILIRISPGRAITMTVVTLWLPVSIVVWLPVVSTLVAHISLRMCLVEMALVAVVGVDIESPSTPMPCQRTIEVGQADILVILVSSQNKLKVSIATAPPNTVHVVASVNTHQVVEIDFIDCLILCCREVQLVSHLVRKEQSLILGCIIAHCVGSDGHHHQDCHKHHLLHNQFSYSLELDNLFLVFTYMT